MCGRDDLVSASVTVQGDQVLTASQRDELCRVRVPLARRTRAGTCIRRGLKGPAHVYMSMKRVFWFGFEREEVRKGSALIPRLRFDYSPSLSLTRLRPFVFMLPLHHRGRFTLILRNHIILFGDLLVYMYRVPMWFAQRGDGGVPRLHEQWRQPHFLCVYIGGFPLRSFFLSFSAHPIG